MSWKDICDRLVSENEKSKGKYDFVVYELGGKREVGAGIQKATPVEDRVDG